MEFMAVVRCSAAFLLNIWIYRTTLIIMLATGLTGNNFITGDWFASENCATEAGVRAESNVSTGIKFLLPSYGQTGTSSVIQALGDMGLRAFHVDKVGVYASPVLYDHEWVNPAILSRVATRCRIEAWSMEPITDALPLVLETSPGAKVIMTWRTYWPWYQSSGLGGASKDINWSLQLLYIFSAEFFFPWSSIWDAFTGELRHARREALPATASVGSFLMRYTQMKYWDSKNRVMERGTYKGGAMEEAYLAHINEIRQLTPAHRLLEFDVSRHGWEELANFTGLPGKPAGTPFPRVRNKALWTNDPHFHGFSGSLRVMGCYAVLHFVNQAIFAIISTPFRRAARRAACRLRCLRCCSKAKAS